MVILDLRHIRNQIERDASIWVARQALDTNEIIEGLINEDMTPREYPGLIDYISDYVDNCSDVRNVMSDNTLDIVSIQLEWYQLLLDRVITKAISDHQYCLRYEVVKWLGDYTAVVAINAADESSHHASPPYTQSTPHTPSFQSAVRQLLRPR